VRGLFAFALVTVLWLLVAPSYNRFMAWTAAGAFAALESPDVTRVTAPGGELWIHRLVDGAQPKPFMRFDLFVYVGFIPLMTLLAVTPGLSRLRRLRAMAIGGLLLALVHVVFLVGAVRLLYVAYGLSSVSATGSTVCRGAEVLLRLIWEGSALLIWAALALGAWREKRASNGWRQAPAHAVRS
jgi:hypothetical protein